MKYDFDFFGGFSTFYQKLLEFNKCILILYKIQFVFNFKSMMRERRNIEVVHKTHFEFYILSTI